MLKVPGSIPGEEHCDFLLGWEHCEFLSPHALERGAGCTELRNGDADSAAMKASTQQVEHSSLWLNSFRSEHPEGLRLPPG